MIRDMVQQAVPGGGEVERGIHVDGVQLVPERRRHGVRDAVDELGAWTQGTARGGRGGVGSEMAEDVGAPFGGVVEGLVAVQHVEETGVGALLGAGLGWDG